MNSQELRALQEAYLDVYENQQLDEADRIDKGLSPLVKRQVRNDRIRGEVSSRDPEAHTEPELQTSRRVMHTAMRGQKKPEAKSRPTGSGKYGAMNRRGMSTSDKFRKEVLKRGMKEELDLYDIILSHLLDEGYADTEQAAQVIMVNMSEDWIEDIVEAAADQSDKQIDKGVKTTYKAQNVLDNQHQGRSRGLNRLPADERMDKTKKMRGRLKARRDDLFGERNKREDESRAELKKKYGL